MLSGHELSHPRHSLSHPSDVVLHDLLWGSSGSHLVPVTNYQSLPKNNQTPSKFRKDPRMATFRSDTSITQSESHNLAQKTYSPKALVFQNRSSDTTM